MNSTPAPIDLGTLLAQQDFVRRLAHGLVFEQANVDDVVQDAWLAALQNPPREPRAIHTWFGRVVENLARRRSRDAARRDRRERAAAAPEAQPSVDTVLAREELRSKVVAAVLALEEPYRGVLLERYFEPREPNEIAKRRGVPAATVRSQCKRGLDLLRARLDASCGDRRSWSLGLVPLARPLPRSGVVASVAGAAALTKLVLVAGALLVTALGAWLFTRGPDAAQAITSAGVPLATAAASTTLEVESESRPSATPADTDLRTSVAKAGSAAATVVAGFRGRLLDPKGLPARGAAVRFVGFDPLTMFADADAHAGRDLMLVRRQAHCADDGVFVVDDLPPRGSYAVQLDADGGNRTLLLLSVTPSPDEVVDLGDLHLVAKAAVTGRVVDEDGAHIAGAEVLALDLPALMRIVFPLERFDPRQGGFLALPTAVAEGKESEIEYAKRLRTYLGTELVEKTGLDARSDLVTRYVERMPWLDALWNELPIARTTSGSDGTFTLEGAQPGNAWLVVRKPGHVPGGAARVVLHADRRRDLGDVRLERGETVRGRVLDPKGAGVVGAEVRLGVVAALGYRGLTFAEAPANTRADGTFEIRGMVPGRAFVAVRAPGDALWHVEGPEDLAGELRITLPADHDLELELRDPASAPIEGAALELLVGPPLGELARLGVQERVRLESRVSKLAHGALRVARLPAGEYTLRVRAPGFATRETVVRIPNEGPLVLAMTRSTELVVRTTTATGAPLTGCRVYAARTDGQDRAILPTSYGLARWNTIPTALGTSAQDGTLRSAARPSGELVVHAYHPHMGWASTRCATTAASVTIAFAEPATIEGRLHDHGKPADPARYAIEVAPLEMEATDDRDAGLGVAALRADASFVVRGLRPGKYRVEAVARKDAVLSLGAFVDAARKAIYAFPFGIDDVTSVQEIELPPGRTGRVEFDLDPNTPVAGLPPARLRGTFTLGTRAPEGAALWIARQGMAQVWTKLAALPADGRFDVPDIAPGAVMVAIRVGDGTWLWSRDLRLTTGEVRVLDLHLPGASVRGRITFAAGLPVVGTTVTMETKTADGHVYRTALADAEGVFRFEHLPAGSYSIRAQSDDGILAARTIEVPAGTTEIGAPLELKEVLALHGWLVGLREDQRDCQLELSGKHNSWIVGVRADGRFAFPGLKPERYSMRLIDGSSKEIGILEPATFDLARGSLRDLSVRVRPK